MNHETEEERDGLSGVTREVRHAEEVADAIASCYSLCGEAVRWELIELTLRKSLTPQQSSRGWDEIGILSVYLFARTVRVPLSYARVIANALMSQSTIKLIIAAGFSVEVANCIFFVSGTAQIVDARRESQQRGE